MSLDRSLLDYHDQQLDRADPREAQEAIAEQLARIQPQVVITFGPEGAYGHPDHIAISQFTTAAIVAAADPSYASADALPPHRVAKLYYMTISRALADVYLAVFGNLTMTVDGVERHPIVNPDWAITTWLDTSDYQEVVWRAVFCHGSQLPAYSQLEHVPEQYQKALWRQPCYYRAFSLVNGGRAIERDLFEGLREQND